MINEEQIVIVAPKTPLLLFLQCSFSEAIPKIPDLEPFGWLDIAKQKEKQLMNSMMHRSLWWWYVAEYG